MMYSSETNNKLIQMYQYNQAINQNTFNIYTLKSLFADTIIIPCGKEFPDGVYLSDSGKAYVEKLLQDNKENRKMKFHRWFNTAIALLALLVAIISLVASGF